MTHIKLIGFQRMSMDPVPRTKLCKSISRGKPFVGFFDNWFWRAHGPAFLQSSASAFMIVLAVLFRLYLRLRLYLVCVRIWFVFAHSRSWQSVQQLDSIGKTNEIWTCQGSCVCLCLQLSLFAFLFAVVFAFAFAFEFVFVSAFAHVSALSLAAACLPVCLPDKHRHWKRGKMGCAMAPEPIYIYIYIFPKQLCW